MESLNARACLIFAVAFGAAPLAAAQDLSANTTPPREPSGTTYEVDLRVDLPIMVIELVVAGGWVLGPQLAPPYCAPICDRDDVWAIDRFAAGWYDEGWALAADIGVATQFVLAGGTLIVDEGFGPAVNEAVVVGQAVAGALALSVISNTSTRRPRPHVYGDKSLEADRMSGRAALSFFSGHTAGAFAAAISTFETLRRRHPGRNVNYVVLGVGLAGGAFVGTARLLGGQHFLTDVLAGAAVGTAMGFLVPALHESPVSLHVDGHSAALGLTLPLDI
jgi:membrane-associated phospholipid phosphatase